MFGELWSVGRTLECAGLVTLSSAVTDSLLVMLGVMFPELPLAVDEETGDAPVVLVLVIPLGDVSDVGSATPLMEIGVDTDNFVAETVVGAGGLANVFAAPVASPWQSPESRSRRAAAAGSQVMVLGVSRLLCRRGTAGSLQPRP